MPPNVKKNVYETIVLEIKRLIETGAYAKGEKLPSVRAYAVERRVNPNTVAKAYAELEKQGYIRVQYKQGAYVCYGEGQPSQECESALKTLFRKIRDDGESLEKAMETLIAVYAERKENLV